MVSWATVGSSVWRMRGTEKTCHPRRQAPHGAGQVVCPIEALSACGPSTSLGVYAALRRSDRSIDRGERSRGGESGQGEAVPPKAGLRCAPTAVRGKRFRPRASARGRQARMPVLPRPRLGPWEADRQECLSYQGRAWPREGLGPSPTYAPRAYTACRVGYTACSGLLRTDPDPGGEGFRQPEGSTALRTVGERLAQRAGAGAAARAAEALAGVGKVGGADGAVEASTACPVLFSGGARREAGPVLFSGGGSGGVGNNGGHRRVLLAG